jgi:brefeldin A-inhibited guanine nucleotide-exchange protein
MSDHLIEVGCHDNESISMGAINSLRQLAVKFLDKDELTNFHYQREFLKPFLNVFLQNSNIKLRSLVKNKNNNFSNIINIMKYILIFIKKKKIDN